MKRTFLLLITGAMLWNLGCGRTEQSPAIALQGLVTSEAEGSMEGVLVSAKASGSTVTITVVSNSEGRYSFPASKLPPGQYNLSIRAVGYDLDGAAVVEVGSGSAAQADLKLRETDDLASQLTNAEWLLSIPGTEEQKHKLGSCVSCHPMELLARSRHDATAFIAVLRRMSTYAQGASPQNYVKNVRPAANRAEIERAYAVEQTARQAEYLSSINLSAVSQWEYPLKTLPRPKGKGTRVIITEYDLPRSNAQPHDAAVDSEGMVWYCDFGQQFLGRLDPKTAQVVEYPLPDRDPERPTGCLDVRFDREGYIWLGLMFGGGFAKFDPKTQEFQSWSSPKDTAEDRMAMVVPRYLHVDGKVWVGGPNEYQVDLESNEWKAIDYLRDVPKDSPIAARRRGVYGVRSDSQNNFYGMELNDTHIIKVDAKTLKVTFYPTPTPDSGPRRGNMDSQDRLWFAEHRGNTLAMFDTKTEQFQEWALPTPWTVPYDAILDNNGMAWTGGMHNDLVARLNTNTGEFTEYLLPRSTNIRRVDVDNATTPPTFWVGNNHGASIIKVEPLD